MRHVGFAPALGIRVPRGYCALDNPGQPVAIPQKNFRRRSNEELSHSWAICPAVEARVRVFNECPWQC
jgi:hypothetical protein